MLPDVCTARTAAPPHQRREKDRDLVGRHEPVQQPRPRRSLDLPSQLCGIFRSSGLADDEQHRIVRVQFPPGVQEQFQPFIRLKKTEEENHAGIGWQANRAAHPDSAAEVRRRRDSAREE